MMTKKISKEEAQKQAIETAKKNAPQEKLSQLNTDDEPTITVAGVLIFRKLVEKELLDAEEVALYHYWFWLKTRTKADRKHMKTLARKNIDELYEEFSDWNFSLPLTKEVEEDMSIIGENLQNMYDNADIIEENTDGPKEEDDSKNLDG